MADKRVVEPENLSASADAPEAEGAEQTATTEAKYKPHTPARTGSSSTILVVTIVVLLLVLLGYFLLHSYQF